MTRARQAALPGMESKKCKEIEDAAFSYADARDTRIANGSVEQEKEKLFLDAMHRNKLRKYHNSDANLSVEIVAKDPKEKVKVLIKAEAGDEGDEK